MTSHYAVFFLLSFSYIWPGNLLETFFLHLARNIEHNESRWFFQTRRLVRSFLWNSSIDQSSSIPVELKSTRILRSNIDIPFQNNKAGRSSKKLWLQKTFVRYHPAWHQSLRTKTPIPQVAWMCTKKLVFLLENFIKYTKRTIS